MAEDCIFCKIAAGTIPSNVVFQDDACVAFRDINPQAPTHVLVIPREHIVGLGDLGESEAATLGHLLVAAAEVAESEGLSERGYRVVINWGPDAGMAVPHLHLHVIGGRAMLWPPG